MDNSENEEEHRCWKEEKNIKSAIYGEAYYDIYYDEDENIWLLTNDEYASAIKYCPICGKLLPVDQSRSSNIFEVN